MKKACTDKCIMMLFWAEWHEPCHILRDQMGELAKVHKELKFTWCNSDEATDLVDKFDINAVPTLAVFHPHKQQPD
jgi:thioredoxin-like negative regulator of GroEL